MGSAFGGLLATLIRRDDLWLHIGYSLDWRRMVLPALRL
jgi:hypothetical protein